MALPKATRTNLIRCFTFSVADTHKIISNITWLPAGGVLGRSDFCAQPATLLSDADTNSETCNASYGPDLRDRLRDRTAQRRCPQLPLGSAEYEGAVRRAQERLWTPYFELLRTVSYRKRLMPFFGAPVPRRL